MHAPRAGSTDSFAVANSIQRMSLQGGRFQVPAGKKQSAALRRRRRANLQLLNLILLTSVPIAAVEPIGESLVVCVSSDVAREWPGTLRCRLPPCASNFSFLHLSVIEEDRANDSKGSVSPLQALERRSVSPAAQGQCANDSTTLNSRH